MVLPIRCTPEELHNLAEAEKEKAIDLLNRVLGISQSCDTGVVRAAVECIIKATMLYNSEIHTESLNELFEKMKSPKRLHS